MEIEDILRENIGRYNLPSQKVLTQEVQDIYPKWEDTAREKFWWERDNIQSSTVFLQFHLCKDMTLDETLTEKAANLRKLHASLLFIHKLLLTIGGCETQLSDTGIDPNVLIERGTYFASSVPIHFSSKEVDAKAEIAAIRKSTRESINSFRGILWQTPASGAPPCGWQKMAKPTRTGTLSPTSATKRQKPILAQNWTKKQPVLSWKPLKKELST